jgi:hypothetical protein
LYGLCKNEKDFGHKILAIKAVEVTKTIFFQPAILFAALLAVDRTITVEREQGKRNLLYDLPARSPNDDNVPIGLHFVAHNDGRCLAKVYDD